MRFGALLALALAPPVAGAAALDVEVLGRDGKPLAGAVVFLESPSARAASRPLRGVAVEQAGKRFTQAVTVVTVGTAVSFPNRDTVRHHVYSFSPAKTFELKLYIGTPAHPVVFDQPGIAVLGCNIHDTMAAWVVIVETPHHGQTAANGRLRLADVPPGSYRLRAWHADLPPGAPALEQALQLPAQGAQAQLRLAVQGVEGAKT
ncbi:MAG: methylamine utilization protein [Rubrivivax sp.]|jgi:plastocyanin|nr:methylamine utilization protein [Rubrivivax sp.]